MWVDLHSVLHKELRKKQVHYYRSRSFKVIEIGTIESHCAISYYPNSNKSRFPIATGILRRQFRRSECLRRFTVTYPLSVKAVARGVPLRTTNDMKFCHKKLEAIR